MRVENISNVQALLFVGAVLLFAYVLFRVVPGVGLLPSRAYYTDEEIRQYDPALPKYFLAAAAALALGGLHAAVKNVPPVQTWLATGGHGGHLVRDMANTHLNIVIGGTVAATGLTWLVLPRLLGRPLASRRLATASFWGTVVGAGGFYLSNVVAGLVLARLHHEGIPYDPTGKEMLGAWRSVPIAGFAAVMGIGYWTFVANVVLTVFKGRHVRAPRPNLHQAKFFVVGALGLTVGTVQGVIQVMPDNEAWLHAAGPAGQYIDPIAHAHVNLVTGTLMLIAGLVFWWTRTPGSAAERRTEDVVFWLMLIGSGAFYLTFMRVGWVEGHLMTEQGMSWDEAVAELGAWHTIPIAAAGTLMLAGLWSLLFVVARRTLAGRLPRPVGALTLLGCAALFVGSLQGVLQVVPAVKGWLEESGRYGEELANAHAQLNMLGGVVVVLFALGLYRSREMFGRAAPAGVVRALARWSVPGIGLYYVSAVVGLVIAGRTVVARGGAPDHHSLGHSHGAGGTAGPAATEAAAQVDSIVPAVLSPLGMAVGAALYAVGFAVVARYAWAATATMRAEGRARLLTWADAYQGAPPAWRARIPGRYYIGAEFPGACAGFPGIGWIMSGRPLIGLPLALINPAIVWGVIPVLTADVRGLWQQVTVGWLAGSAGLSLGLLTLLVVLGRRPAGAVAPSPPGPEPAPVPGPAPAVAP